jgi:hypothetical protein
MSSACSTHGAKRNAYRILVGKTEGKRPLGTPRSRWEDNIKMDLRKIGWDRIELSQDRDQWRVLVNMVMKLQVPMLGSVEWLSDLQILKKGSALWS